MQQQKEQMSRSVLRGLQLWPLLVHAARHKQLLYYSDIAPLVGVPDRGLSAPLGYLQRFCESKQLPYLTALVVSKAKGEPSHGCNAKGPADLVGVFNYDWFQVPAPTLEDLHDLDESA